MAEASEPEDPGDDHAWVQDDLSAAPDGSEGADFGGFRYHEVKPGRSGQRNSARKRRGHRQGGGRRSNAREEQEQQEGLVDMVHAFARAVRDGVGPTSFSTPTGLTNAQRRLIHVEAKRVGLASQSKGDGKSRHVVLYGGQDDLAALSDRVSQEEAVALAGLAVTEPEFPEPAVAAAARPSVPDRPQRSVLQAAAEARAAAAEAAERRRGRLAQVGTERQ